MASQDDERYYTNPGDIYGVFRALQADRSTINIQFGGTGPLYNSLILKADLRRRRVHLDEITPSAGHDRAAEGQPFSLRASVNGIRVYAPELRVVRQATDADGIYYEVVFPEKLLYLQRRDAFRVPVPARLEMTARCTFADREEELAAGVDNLSATGIRLTIPEDTESALQAMSQFSLRLALPAPEKGDLELRATVMHQHHDQTRKLLVLGCRFDDLQRSQHITLNRVVTQLQREMLT